MTEHTEQTEQTEQTRAGAWAGGRHPLNVGHLVMGLVLLGMSGLWLLVVNDVVADDDLQWLLPVPWVVAGLGGLAALGVNAVRRHGATTER